MNQNISIASIHRCIETFKYSFKRISLEPIRRNTENNIEARFVYARQLLELDVTRLIFIDEFGVNCSMRKRYGRSIVGETPKKQVTTVRSRNFSVCAACKSNKLLYFEVKEGGYNGETYGNYLANLLQMLKTDNLQNQVIICDNVAFHKMAQIRELVKNNNHELFFLPPYSPQLNPIEEVFAAWKEHIRSSNCQNNEQLLRTIQNASERITPEHCQNYFRHMNSFLVKAVARESF